MLAITYLYQYHFDETHINHFFKNYYQKLRLWFEWFYNS